jgi:DNA-binding NarL/FixJ family response regulator
MPKINPEIQLLTAREREVVAHIAQGKKYSEIAEALSIGYNTVKVYANRIRRKLKLSDKLAVGLWAYRNGFGNRKTR